MSLYYLDTSAAIKLLIDETHSAAFADFYDHHPDATWVSSDLVRIELIRAVNRVLPAALLDARELLLAIDTVAMDENIVTVAMGEPDRLLRSLDAIHLATARLLGAELRALVTYDNRLAAAARDAGIPVLSPGAPWRVQQ